ncbi:MAG: DUF3568 family protein [Alphaproteobacteria bacterium]
MKTLRIALIVLVALNLQACASANHAKNAQGEGIKMVYSASYDNTWDASIAAIAATNGKIVEQDQKQGVIAASYGVTAFSWGERVALFLKTLTSKKTEVEVVSKRAVATNITAADWVADIHQELAKTLGSAE